MNKDLKDSILKLRSEGKTYNEIKSILNCSKGTIAYHCSNDVKRYYSESRRKNRKKFITETKIKEGGKCTLCGYDKCLNALEFHHIDPAIKQKYRNAKGIQISVAQIATVFSQEKALNEIKKCILLCANCHREVEAGITFIPVSITNLVNLRLSSSDYVEVL